jgi:hypothetical protein
VRVNLGYPLAGLTQMDGLTTHPSSIPYMCQQGGRAPPPPPSNTSDITSTALHHPTTEHAVPPPIAAPLVRPSHTDREASEDHRPIHPIVDRTSSSY